MKLQKTMVLFWLGGGAILFLTFGGLAWVVYFGKTKEGVEFTFLDIVLETLPLFLAVVCIGVLISWIRTVTRGRDSDRDSEKP